MRKVDYGIKKKITSLNLSFEDFINRIDSEINPIFRSLTFQETSTENPIYKKFTTSDLKPTESLKNFINEETDFIHNALPAKDIDPKNFYKGYFENWYPIINNLDVERKIKDSILSEIFLSDEYNTSSKQNLFIIKGVAGSGKSVLLKRLAWDAGTTFDKLCIFCKETINLKYAPIAELYNYCRERIYLFIDTAAQNSDEIINIITNGKKDNIPITIISSERTNVWNTDCEKLNSYLTDDYSLKYLEDNEILGLLNLLEKYNSLGTLKNKNLTERIEALSFKAGRELLVALYEATLGKPFAEIIKNEYESINNETAKSLYLTVAIFHRLGAETRAGFISRVHGIAFNDFKEKLFKPLESIIFDRRNYKINDYIYLTRHRHIAEIVFEEVLNNQQDRYDEYIRIINHLDIGYDSDRTAFQAMTNAKKLLEIFTNPLFIRNIYDKVKEDHTDDPMVLQQEAIFEMSFAGGNMKTAEKSLIEAHTIAGNNTIISHTLAEFQLKRAEKANTKIEKEKYLIECEKICESIIKKNNTDPHSFHTLIKSKLARLSHVMDSNDNPAIERLIKDIEKTFSKSKQYFPHQEFILEAESKFNKLLDNKPEALALLVKAFEANKASPFIALRLASVYEFLGEYEDGLKVLSETLSINQNEKDVNYKYAVLLSKLPNPDYQTIKYYLRRSFTKGDSRFEAQFWYGRCLYLCNEIEEAKKIFEITKNFPADPKIKNKARGRIKKNQIPILFTGNITMTEFNYGFIKRDEIGDDIFFSRHNEDYKNWENFKKNTKVSFVLAFTYKGPVAINVRIIK